MNTAYIREQVKLAADNVRKSKPLAGSITNFVTVNFVANAQLAAGGSAAMVYLPDEGEGLAKMGDSMYINVGTLLPIYEETVPRTLEALRELGKPWVLDPVAVGLGELRTKLLLQCKEYKPSVVRGNASEIIALAGLWQVGGNRASSKVRGVDSTDTVDEAVAAAKALAAWTGGAVAVSGAEDFITDGRHDAVSYGGSPMMECVTGSGCSLGGVIAVYAAVADPFIAAIAGTAAYNLAGRRAEAKAAGIGSFQQLFLDELYQASPEDISQNPISYKEEP